MTGCRKILYLYLMITVLSNGFVHQINAINVATNVEETASSWRDSLNYWKAQLRSSSNVGWKAAALASLSVIGTLAGIAWMYNNIFKSKKSAPASDKQRDEQETRAQGVRVHLYYAALARTDKEEKKQLEELSTKLEDIYPRVSELTIWSPSLQKEQSPQQIDELSKLINELYNHAITAGEKQKLEDLRNKFEKFFLSTKGVERQEASSDIDIITQH